MKLHKMIQRPDLFLLKNIQIRATSPLRAAASLLSPSVTPQGTWGGNFHMTVKILSETVAPNLAEGPEENCEKADVRHMDPQKRQDEIPKQMVSSSKKDISKQPGKLAAWIGNVYWSHSHQ